MSKMKTKEGCRSRSYPCADSKGSAEVLSEPFSTLYNFILDTGKFPRSWKQGEITPVHKKESVLTMENYRPLTILPSLSKVFETLLHIRVSPCFDNILHKYIFAYRKHYCCDTPLLSLSEKWRKELDNRKIVGLVSLDLSKAFDSCLMI